MTPSIELYLVKIGFLLDLVSIITYLKLTRIDIVNGYIGYDSRIISREFVRS
jgi:hypothetical protein